MSSDDEVRIRGKLAEVIGHGLDRIESSKKLNPTGRLQSKSIIASLKAVARNLQEVETILRGMETGLRQGCECERSHKI